MLQTCGFSFFQSIFKLKPALVVDVVVEVDVHADGGVGEEEETGLRHGETVGVFVQNH